jgi:Asp-tRNA(Asn)/Glu-tRNA(Gln) amidotransferase A subunit family amidase
MSRTLLQYINDVQSGLISPEKTQQEYLTKAKKLNADNNAFIHFTDEYCATK